MSGREVFLFKPELVEADADDDEATEDMSIYRRADDGVSSLLWYVIYIDGSNVCKRNLTWIEKGKFLKKLCCGFRGEYYTLPFTL